MRKRKRFQPAGKRLAVKNKKERIREELFQEDTRREEAQEEETQECETEYDSGLQGSDTIPTCEEEICCEEAEKEGTTKHK